MTCKLHPKYKAIHHPRSTTKHPNGCQDCRAIYENKVGNLTPFEECSSNANKNLNEKT